MRFSSAGRLAKNPLTTVNLNPILSHPTGALAAATTSQNQDQPMTLLSIVRRFFVVIPTILLAVIGGTAQAGTTVLFVNQNAAANSLRNGSSWANAYTDLSVAISNAHPTASSPVEI